MTIRSRTGGRSATIDVDGPVHYVDFGGSGPPLLLVHGLGGSHLNWMMVASPLTEHFHVVALDLIGFGLTPPASRSCGIGAQVRLVAAFIEEALGGSAHLIGNSMGGLIAALTAARHPERVDHLVLVDPALPPRDGAAFIDPGNLSNLAMPLVPVVGPRRLQRQRTESTAADRVAETMEYVTPHPERIPDAYVEASTFLEEERRHMDWSIDAFVGATRSLAATLVPARRLLREFHSIGAPTMLIQGAEDRLVRATSGRWLAAQRPDWTYVELDDVGHVPMIEVPDRFVELVGGFIPLTR